MSYKFAYPSQKLMPFIKHYWAMEIDMQTPQSYNHRIIPTGLTDLTFFFGNVPSSNSDNHTISEGAILSGQQGAFYDLKIENSFRLISVVFTPEGLARFFAMPISELESLSIEMNETLLGGMRELTDLMYEAGLPTQVDLLNNFFEQLLTISFNGLEEDRIKHAVNLASETKGQIKIVELANELCLSRKQFERVFLKRVGASPKQFLKTVRLQNAIYQKSKMLLLPLTELSYKCGYYDQSHMVNDFKKLTGENPSSFFKLNEPFSDYFG